MLSNLSRNIGEIHRHRVNNEMSIKHDINTSNVIQLIY